jgi:hypothetical protein
MLYPEGSTHTIVPAAPNWFVAWPGQNQDGTKGVTLETIIAWLIVHSFGEYSPRIKVPRDEKCCHVDCYPITTDGVVEEIGVLKDPSGQFIRPNDRSYDNEKEFLADWSVEEKIVAVKLIPKS